MKQQGHVEVEQMKVGEGSNEERGSEGGRVVLGGELRHYTVEKVKS